MNKITSSHLHLVEQSRTPQQTKNQYIADYPNDSFEYLNQEIEDTPSFTDRLKSLFGKTNSSNNDCKVATAQMQQNAQRFFFEAMKTKKEVQELISVAEIYGFRDITGLDGNLIKFEEDNLGRKVMIECDENSQPKRTTTFFKSTNEIQSIDIHESEKSQTRIVFFNQKTKSFEVRKENSYNCVGNYRDEVYCYEHNKPTTFVIKKGNVFKNDVKRETYIF